MTAVPVNCHDFFLSIGARDDQEAEAPALDVEVRLCSGCNGHGVCDFDNETTVETEEETLAFRRTPCSCYTGWTGKDYAPLTTVCSLYLQLNDVFV